MIKSDYIVFDCETGGLDFKKNPITQFAGIILDGKTLKEKDRWETFVKPYHSLVIEKEALNKTMVTMSDINGGVDITSFVKTLVTWLESHRAKTKIKEMGRLIPVGQNIPFDLGFVNEALILEGHNEGIYSYLYTNFIDTFPLAKLAWGVTGEEKLNLGANCERAKIKLTDAHGAMNDTEATANLLRWFMKKIRSNKGDSKDDSEESRIKGQEYFEFKCGAK